MELDCLGVLGERFEVMGLEELGSERGRVVECLDARVVDGNSAG